MTTLNEWNAALAAGYIPPAGSPGPTYGPGGQLYVPPIPGPLQAPLREFMSREQYDTSMQVYNQALAAGYTPPPSDPEARAQWEQETSAEYRFFTGYGEEARGGVGGISREEPFTGRYVSGGQRWQDDEAIGPVPQRGGGEAQPPTGVGLIGPSQQTEMQALYEAQEPVSYTYDPMVRNLETGGAELANIATFAGPDFDLAPGQSITLTSEEARLYGMQIGLDDRLVITADEYSDTFVYNPAVPRFSATLLAKDGSVMDEQGNIHADGVIYTPQDIVRQQQVYNSTITVLGENWESQYDIASDEGMMQFFTAIQQAGKNEDTVNILKSFQREDGAPLNSTDIAEFFGIEEKMDWRDGYKFVAQEIGNFIKMKPIAAWAGRESIAEVLFPALANKSILDYYRPGMELINEFSETYVFEPWRLMCAELGVAVALQLDEWGVPMWFADEEDIEAYTNFAIAMQSAYHDEGFAYHLNSPKVIEAYETLLETQGLAGTLQPWVADLTNPAFWIPIGPAIKGVKWVVSTSKINKAGNFMLTGGKGLSTSDHIFSAIPKTAITNTELKAMGVTGQKVVPKVKPQIAAEVLPEGAAPKVSLTPIAPDKGISLMRFKEGTLRAYEFSYKGKNIGKVQLGIDVKGSKLEVLEITSAKSGTLNRDILRNLDESLMQLAREEGLGTISILGLPQHHSIYSGAGYTITKDLRYVKSVPPAPSPAAVVAALPDSLINNIAKLRNEINAGQLTGQSMISKEHQLDLLIQESKSLQAEVVTEAVARGRIPSLTDDTVNVMFGTSEVRPNFARFTPIFDDMRFAIEMYPGQLGYSRIKRLIDPVLAETGALSRVIGKSNVAWGQAAIDKMGPSSMVRLIKKHSVGMEDLGLSEGSRIVEQMERVYGVPHKFMKLDKYGTVHNRTTGILRAKSTAPKLKNGETSWNWGDISSNADDYIWAPEAKGIYNFVQEENRVLKELVAMLKAEGIEIETLFFKEQSFYMPRKIIGKDVPVGLFDDPALIGDFEVFGGSRAGRGRNALETAQHKRRVEFMGDNALSGLHAQNPSEALVGYIAGAYRMVGRKHGADIIDNSSLKIFKPTVTVNTGVGPDAGLITSHSVDWSVGEALNTLNWKSAPFMSMNVLRRTKIAGLRIGPVTKQVLRAEDLERIFTKAFGDKAPSWLEKTAMSNRIMVTMMAALDHSGPLIQGVPMVGHDLSILARVPTRGPGILKYDFSFMRAATESLYTMIRPGYAGRWRGKYEIRMTQDEMRNTPAIMADLRTGGRAHEYTAGVVDLNNTLGRLPVVGPYAVKPYQITTRAFDVFGEMGRTYMFKGYKEIYKVNGFSTQELGNVVNLLTGVTSTRFAGVSATQRAAEGSALFASRYLRSNLMVVRGLFRGGLTGKILRENLLFSAIGWLGSYSALAAAMGQDPRDYLKPWPKDMEVFGMEGSGAEFMSIEVGGKNIGLPGFWVGYARMWGGVLAMLTDPENMKKVFRIDWTDLKTLPAELKEAIPAFKWLAGKQSPLVGILEEILTGKDYFGNDLSLGDKMEGIYTSFMAISLQGIFIDGGPKTVLGAFAEWFGARTSPDSANEIFQEAVDEVLYSAIDNDDFLSKYPLDEDQQQKMDDGELGWYDLNSLQRPYLLKMNPDLQMLWDNYTRDKEAWETADRKAYRAETDIIDQQETDRKADIIDRVRNDPDFSMDDIGTALSNWYKDKAIMTAVRDAAHPETLQYFADTAEKYKDTAPQFNLAVDNWWATTVPSLFKDEVTGKIDWDAQEAAEQAWIRRYGDQYYEWLQDTYARGFDGQDALWETLWEFDKDIEQMYIRDKDGNQDYDARRDWLLKNPDTLAKAIFTGDTSTIPLPYPDPANEQEHNANWEWIDVIEARVMDYADAHDIPHDAIPNFAKWIIPEDMMVKYGITDPLAMKEYQRWPQANSYREVYLLTPGNENLYNYWLEELDHEPLVRQLESYQIDVEWGNQDNEWDAVTGGTRDTRAAERQLILDDPANAGYQEARWTRDAYDTTGPEGQKFSDVSTYVAFKTADAEGGAARSLFLIGNPDFLKEATAILGWEDQEFKDPTYYENKIKWADNDAEYAAFAEGYTKEETAQLREDYLLANPEYAMARYEQSAIQSGFKGAEIDQYVAYSMLPDSHSKNLYLYENPDFYAKAMELLGWDDRELRPQQYYEIRTEWGDQYTEYGDIQGAKEDELRAQYLLDNPEFAYARQQANAYVYGFPEEMINQYATYATMDSSAEQNLYLWDNQKFLTKATELLDWEAKDLHPRKYYELQVEWRPQMDEYGELSGTDTRQRYLDTHSEFEAARWAMDAFTYDMDEKYVGDYVQYMQASKLGGYEDEWFLLANPEFYSAVGKAKGWNMVKRTEQLFNAPSRDVYAQYVDYQNVPKGNQRIAFRCANPNLDAWGAKTGKWQACYGTDRCVQYGGEPPAPVETPGDLPGYGDGMTWGELERYKDLLNKQFPGMGFE